MRVVILLSLFALACTPETPPTPTPAPEPVDETPETPPEPPAIEEPPEELELPEARTIRLNAQDGLELVGDLRTGASPEAALVILVHQLSTDRHEWEPLLRRLAGAPALSTFALDMRGHGESTQRRNREVSWNDFETADWEKVADDVLRALNHLREAEGLAPARVILVGSSIGSSAVILAASRDESVNAVVALSPGRAYRGVDALSPTGELGERALFAVASREEPDSAATAADMARIASAGQSLVVEGNRHGVGMFESAPESLGRVADFIREETTP